MSYQDYDEAVLTLTGTPEWKTLMELLNAENAAATQNQLEASKWEDVRFYQGYRAALEYVYSIREVTKILVEQQDGSV